MHLSMLRLNIDRCIKTNRDGIERTFDRTALFSLQKLNARLIDLSRASQGTIIAEDIEVSDSLVHFNLWTLNDMN